MSTEDAVMQRVRAFEEVDAVARDVAKVVSTYYFSLKEEDVPDKVAADIANGFSETYWNFLFGQATKGNQ